MPHDFVVVIPARFGASRLPGKPLRMLAGKPLVQHVWERACESGASEVVIATDDDRICEAARGFGAQVCKTSASHPSGTDRLAEVAQLRRLEPQKIVVNLQGDEPLVPPTLIAKVAGDLAHAPDAMVATLASPIHDAAELFDPHAVKVVRDARGYALYFSRAPIPWDRETFSLAKSLSQTVTHYRHIGLYAYRAGFLHEYRQWPTCDLERAESLEQLRVLWHGHGIHVAITEQRFAAGVDTEADLKRVEEALLNWGNAGG